MKGMNKIENEYEVGGYTVIVNMVQKCKTNLFWTRWFVQCC